MEDDEFDEEEEEDGEEGEEVLLINYDSFANCTFNEIFYAGYVGRRRGRPGPGLQTEENSCAWSKGSS